MTFPFPLFVIGILCIQTTTCFAQELPIKPARTVSLTTDEGSYMNVDVSPDGKTLAFDLLGDLYAVPVEGGSAIQLTRGVALHLRPVWSPDGKRIAYLSDISGAYHLNVMDLAGKFHIVLGSADKELIFDPDPLWTPDGHYIYIATGGGAVYGLAGGKVSVGINVKNPIRFSTNGQLVYGLDSDKLFVYDQTARSKSFLLPKVPGFERASLSPNARWWAYIADSNGKRCLIVLDLSQDTSRILVPALTLKDPRNNAGLGSPHFCFSPDSRSIFIGYGGKIHRLDVESGVDTVIPFTAHVKSDLGPYSYHTYRVAQDSVQVKYTRSANANPDGKRLIFTALGRIYIMDLPNGKPHVLAKQPIAQFQPVYSPDGQWIAYVSWCDTAGGALWRVPATGGRPEQLSHLPGQYQRPAWSPDGALIAVVRGAPKLGDRDDPGIGRLELIPVNGGPERPIDDSVPLWNQLAFSPDGHRILYTPKARWERSHPLIPQLVSRDLEGNGLQVAAIGAGLTFYQQKLLSPDGRYFVYSADEDLYLIPVCNLADTLVISDESRRLPVIRFAAGVDPYWEQGGKMLAWSYGNVFYRANPDKIMVAAEKTIAKSDSAQLERDFLTVNVEPDQLVIMKVKVPENHAYGLLALRNVRIITMEKDKVIEEGTILIKDGQITAVGPTTMVPIPVNAKVLDLPGTTVMPGIVDMHLHMRVPTNVFPQQSWMFLVNLAYGVTTARDPSASFDSFGYAELLASGQMMGPRLYTVGRAVRTSDGLVRPLESLEDARRVVQKRAELGAIVVKDYLWTFPRLPRQWLLQASDRFGLNITNEGFGNPLMEIGMMKDGCAGVEHNPLWGDVYKDVTSFVAKSGTWFTPTLQVSSGSDIGEGKEYFKYKYWHQPNEKLRRFTYSDTAGKSQINNMESYEAIINTICNDSLNPHFLTPAHIDAQIRHAGGRVTMGSHGEAEGIGAHNEIWALQAGGFTIMEALQSATIMGAEAMGLQKDIGSIEVGKIADLIILNKNPLDDIHNSREIRYVMKDGILYDGDTLDELWPTFKKCPEWRLKQN